MQISFKIIDRLLPQQTVERPDDIHMLFRQRIFAFFVSMGVFICILVSGYQIISGYPFNYYVMSMCMVSFFSSLALLKFYNNFMLASSIFLLSVNIAVFLGILTSGGYASPSLLWALTFSIVATFIMGIKWGTVWALFGLILVMLAGFMNTHYSIDLPMVVPNQSYYAFSFVLTTFTILMLVVFYEQEKDAYHARLEKILYSNQNLLSIVCHDIANPNTTINLSASNFMDLFKKHEKEVPVPLLRIIAANNIISDIITHVRQLQAIEKKKFVPKNEKVDLVNGVKQSLFLVEDRYKDKNIEIEVVWPEAAEIDVQGDRTLLSSTIISNVLSNAIKFSFPNSKIEITFEIHELDVTVIIKDYGLGMSSELMSKIFQLDAHTSRRGTSGEMGTGFGMPLVKKYIESFGGKIFIESHEEKERPFGTQVWLSFKKWPS